MHACRPCLLRGQPAPPRPCAPTQRMHACGPPCQAPNPTSSTASSPGKLGTSRKSARGSCAAPRSTWATTSGVWGGGGQAAGRGGRGLHHHHAPDVPPLHASCCALPGTSSSTPRAATCATTCRCSCAWRTTTSCCQVWGAPMQAAMRAMQRLPQPRAPRHRAGQPGQAARASLRAQRGARAPHARTDAAPAPSPSCPARPAHSTLHKPSQA